MIKRTTLILALAAACSLSAAAQKGTAESGYYISGYNGDTWTGEVTAVDNDKRELTLTYVNGKKTQTFVVTVPDGPFGWSKDSSGDRVLLFVAPDKKAKAAQADTERPDLKEFVGHRIKVYYVEKEKKDGDHKIKFNEAIQIKPLPAK
ncbi:MAG: hypothetical protein M3268_01680 [Acidobacteriota bacterium]|nr:hypothetical protein [Acidobacteriota bacterium]